MIKETMHIGFDDTDSVKGGCTTYIAALLVEELERLDAEFIDYPNLIRLNPNVPWKTRGNGALCIRIRCDENSEDRVKESVVSTVEDNSDLTSKGTDPGIVFFPKATVPREFQMFAASTITGVVKLTEATRLIRKFQAEALGFNSRRGIIGALAAIGETLQNDYTYEILAYRAPENCGTKRCVDTESIFRMNRLTSPLTFNNVDEEKKRVIITPRGPDPILFGVRGETAAIVKKAFKLVSPLEQVERWVIFRSNQGTDAHLKHADNLGEAKPHNPIIAEAMVSAEPRVIPGKHVIFSVKDDVAEVACAAYEPSGALRHAARELIIGDKVEVSGGVRARSSSIPLTINLEKIRVLNLARKVSLSNPVCVKCGKRLESMGRGQGFRCKKCKSKYADLAKAEVAVKRNLQKSLYIASPRSQRHLTKPFVRYGQERRLISDFRMIEGWHWP
jgi:tRNA(Ile2)-agmatinylcytidine synthase